MRASDRKKIHRMEIEDDLGIKRGKKSKLIVSIKTYKIIKLILIALIPILYFVCSPMLILVMFAYLGLLFITKNVEKNLNQGLRKDLHVYLPKADSILCILLVIVTVAGTIVSSVSTTQRKSPFEGMDSTQMEEFVKDADFDSANFKFIQLWNKIKEIGTLMTGTRYFFTSQDGFRGGFGGGGKFEGFEPPEGFTPPSGDFSPPDMNNMLQNLPFEMLFESILKAVNSAILLIICVCGIASFRKIRKVTAS